MDWFRNLSPRGKRLAIVGGGVAVGLIFVLMSRRSSAAPAKATEATAPAGGAPVAAGVLPGAYLPNAGYDSGTSDLLSGIAEGLDGLRDDIARMPTPTGSSDIAREVGEVLRPIFDGAQPAPVTTAPVVGSTPPVAAAPLPTPAPAAPARPAPQTGPVGGRRVGPWATKAMRDDAVKGVPANKVRKYTEGGKFYAEIFD